MATESERILVLMPQWSSSVIQASNYYQVQTYAHAASTNIGMELSLSVQVRFSLASFKSSLTQDMRHESCLHHWLKLAQKKSRGLGMIYLGLGFRGWSDKGRILRSVYTGDFCGDFAACKLLAIPRRFKPPVVYIAKSRLKSQQKSPV